MKTKKNRYDIAAYLKNERAVMRLAIAFGLANSESDFVYKFGRRFRALYNLYGKVTLDMLR